MTEFGTLQHKNITNQIIKLSQLVFEIAENSDLNYFQNF
jgi:hypothetical protein